MKIVLFDPPYQGIGNYAAQKKSSGLTNNLTREKKSCSELINVFFSDTPTGLSKDKEQFLNIEISALLASDDITCYEPPKMQLSGDEHIDYAIIKFAEMYDKLFNELPDESKINLLNYPFQRQGFIEDAIDQCLKEEELLTIRINADIDDSFEEYDKTDLFSKIFHEKGILNALWESNSNEIRIGIFSTVVDLTNNFYPFDYLLPNDNGLFLSRYPYLNYFYFSNINKITPDNILAILAISGIDIIFPSINTCNFDIIDEVKEKFSDEREDYIAYLQNFIGECYSGIKSETYEDVWDYANYNSNNKLKSKLYEFEKAIRDSDKKLAGRFFKTTTDKSAVITQAILTGNFVQAGWELLQTFVSTINSKPERHEIHEKLPFISYLYHIKNRS